MSSPIDNIPKQDSNPNLRIPNSSNSEETEKSKVVGMAGADFIYNLQAPLLQHIQFFDGNFVIKHQSEGVGGIDKQEVGKIVNLIDGSNKLMRKCSLNDIIFLVMLIMTKSASDQRQSRAELWSNKKNVSNTEAINVYQMGINAAKETYELTMENIRMQKWMAGISIGLGIVSLFVGSFYALSTNSATRGLDLIKNASGILGKFISASKFANTILIPLINAGMGIYQGIKGLEFARRQKEISFMQAEREALKGFFDFNMKQMESMVEAYSLSNKHVKNAIDTIKNTLQKTQETKMSIARNI
jgi:hypothetical protein